MEGIEVNRKFVSLFPVSYFNLIHDYNGLVWKFYYYGNFLLSQGPSQTPLEMKELSREMVEISQKLNFLLRRLLL